MSTRRNSDPHRAASAERGAVEPTQAAAERTTRLATHPTRGTAISTWVATHPTRGTAISTRVAERPTRAGGPARRGLLDGAEALALVARSRRGLLLNAHRHRLTREDLEDCYSQATLELLARARGGEQFSSYAHIARALEQKLVSRISDRRRALGGRSPIEAAIATALPLTACEVGSRQIVDVRADVERLALARRDLRRIDEVSGELSHDQRLVLASQLAGEAGCGEFCRAYGWSPEKYRKVAQRARARLTQLLAGEVACPAYGVRSD